MNRSRQSDDLLFRPADEGDQPSLETFTCSRGAPYQDEAQDFIRQTALARALVPGSRYRLHLVLEQDRLAAVFGHHPELLMVSTGQNAAGTPSFGGTTATRLHVLALSVADQGRRLSRGQRLSDMVMETLMSEALGHQQTAVLTAIVAADNLLSLALCERHGLTSQIEYGSGYVRLSGQFVRRG